MPVEHEDIAVVEQSGNPEIEKLIPDLTLKNGRAGTKRAIDYHDRLTANRIVNDLVPDQNPEGIRPSLTAVVESQNNIIVFQIADCRYGRKPGGINRRNPVRGWSPAVNLVHRNRRV